MIKNNIKGEAHELFSSRFIWSDKLQKNIAQNGEHIGIKVGDLVFDNLNPNGIEYSKWANDLGIRLTGLRSTNTKF